jgi:bifunctional enzyme CysN/CysC
VVEALDSFEARPSLAAAALRLPVQGVYKFPERGDDRRIVAGTVESGGLSVGDDIVFYPSGKHARVRTLEGFNARPSGTVSAEQAVGFTLADQIYVARGEIATRAAQPRPHVGTRLRVNLFWLGKRALTPHRDYLLRRGPHE